MGLFHRTPVMPDPQHALVGRTTPLQVGGPHPVLGNSITGDYPASTERAIFAMGCFWGAERKFWVEPGVWTTAVGYTAGFTPNPTYEEVCSGNTGHTEAVLVVFEPGEVTFVDLLKIFWENHDPTQGMRQGNDVGTQYRSGIYPTTEDQLAQATASEAMFQQRLTASGYGPITTEITNATEFYFAEQYHQQYLHKNPNGYCGLGGTGVSCPVGLTPP